MLALSIDPGTICSGWALFNDGELKGCGKIHLKSGMKLSERLAELMWGIQTILDEHSPDMMIVESQFTGRNLKTSLVTARAMGIAIAAAAMAGVKVIEYAPTEVKKAVTGTGKATKEQVTESIITKYGNHALIKELGPYRSSGKDKNDDIYDAIGINDTFWILKDGKEI